MGIHKDGLAPATKAASDKDVGDVLIHKPIVRERGNVCQGRFFGR